MAKKNSEPIITQTEILSMAGRSIQKSIVDLRADVKRLAEKAQTDEQKAIIEDFQIRTEGQVAYHLKRLEAIETMYQIQTGTAIGLID